MHKELYNIITFCIFAADFDESNNKPNKKVAYKSQQHETDNRIQELLSGLYGNIVGGGKKKSYAGVVAA